MVEGQEDPAWFVDGGDGADLADGEGIDPAHIDLRVRTHPGGGGEIGQALEDGNLPAGVRRQW